METVQRTSSSGRRPAGRLRDYGLALVVVAAAGAMALAAAELLHTSATFFPFQLAIAIAAVTGGFAPGVLATIVATLLVGVVFREPFGLPSVATQPDQVSLALFVVEGVAISGLGQLVRNGRAVVEESAREHLTLLAAERAARGMAEHAIARAEGLAATAAALGRALGTDEVADIAAGEGLARLGAGRGVVGLLEPDGRTIRTVSALGFSTDIVRAWPTFDIDDAVPMAEAMRRGEPLILRDAEEIRQRYPSVAATTVDGGPAVVVPLMYEDRAIGGMYFRYVSPTSIAESDRSYLTALGRLCASAVERARLGSSLGDRLRGQEAVARLGQLALLHAELGPLFAAAATELADVLDADITAIMEHVPDRHALRIIAGTGWRVGVVGQTLISDRDHSQAGFALVSDGPVVSRDYADEDRFQPSAVLHEHGARSGATTPILGPNGPWGVIGVHSRRAGHFEADQIALLDTFANVLGSAVSRHATEVALRDRDQRLELALAASRTGFWEWNVRTGRVLWSDENCRIHGLQLGTELEDLEGYLSLVHPEDRAWVRERLEAASQTGRYEARNRIVRPNGVVRWTQSTAKVFFDAGHRAVRMIGVGRDVTEEVELEAERARIAESERRASELGQAFIGVVSHELRTPITSIFAGSKLLHRMGNSPNPNRAELTADIEAESERLYRLTEDLLVLTRVERDNLEIDLEPVALSRVLDRVLASEQERWPLTSIELVVQPGMPIALGDLTYIEQLVRNLVGNAAKYAPEGGKVQVTAMATQGTAGAASEVEIRILDRGPGLADTDADHLFELFYRSPLTAKKAPGAGIGLFVCDHLARAMGGRLWAANREDGGSEFGFSLRAYPVEDAGVTLAPSGARQLDGRAPALAGAAAIREASDSIGA
jgi:signal transduction histidine kinase